MADDRWRMADDRWRMADDRCEVRSGGCGDGENGEPTPEECPDLPAEASPPPPQAPSVEMPQESWDLLYGASTGHWPLFSSLATDYWLLATIPEPLATVLSPLATRHSLLVLYLLRSLACESNVLVALNAVHGQLDVGQGRAVDVALFGSLDEIVGVALEFRGQGHVIGGVGNHRNFPLGRLAQDLQRLGVLLDHGILLERQPFEDILGEFELPPHEFAAVLLLLLPRPAC